MACGWNRRSDERRDNRGANYWNGRICYDVEMRYWGPYFYDYDGRVMGINDDDDDDRRRRCCHRHCGCCCGCCRR